MPVWVPESCSDTASFPRPELTSSQASLETEVAK